MKIIVTLFITNIFSIILSFDSDPQNDYPQYYHLIRESRKLFKEKKYQEAIENYKKATTLVEYVHIQTLLFGLDLGLKAKDCDLAYNSYKKAIEQGHPIRDFSGLKECKINQNTTELTQLSDQSLKKLNNNLKFKIDSIYAHDQSIRTQIVKNGYKIDSSNIIEIKKMIMKYGFVDERLVGEKTANNFFIILLHYDADIENKYLEPIIKQALLEGKISPENFAWIVDRRLAWGPQRKDPIYFQLPTKKLQTLSEEEKVIVDTRRKEIGLKPLAEMNIKFNKDGSIELTEEF